jgi:hypothetical protein
MDKIIIAIDPGAVGGIIISTQNSIISCNPMPETETDVVELIRSAYRESKSRQCEAVCIIEKVGGFAGGDGQPGSAMFNFGKGTGIIYGALLAFKIRVEEVTPQKWQRSLSLGGKLSVKIEKNFPKYPEFAYKEEKKRIARLNAGYKTDWKNKLKAEAQRLYPSVKVTLKTSDALLLLEYYKRFLNK